jgi:hypothetical protein
VDPDRHPHQIKIRPSNKNQDPDLHPDPHQVISWIQNRIRISLQMTSQASASASNKIRIRIHVSGYTSNKNQNPHPHEGDKSNPDQHPDTHQSDSGGLNDATFFMFPKCSAELLL